MNEFRLVIFLTLAAFGSANAQDDLRDVFRDLLPVGTVEMSILFVAADPKIEEISLRMQASIAAKGYWISTYLQEHSDLKPGEILPYHENFGISEEEYKLFLSGMKDAGITEVRQLTLQISEEKIGFKIAAPEEDGFGDVLIDLWDVGVLTENGYIGNCKRVLPNQDNAAIGRWGGITCRVEDGNPFDGNGKHLLFSVGRIQESQQLFIHYVSQVVENGVIVRNADLNLRERSSP